MNFGKIGVGKMMKKAWVNPYVTDCLVAMWDGEWNAGGGKHNDSPTVIADLAGSSPLEIVAPVSSSITIGADYFSPNGIYSGSTANTTTSVAKDAIMNGAATIEVCCYCGEYGGGATPFRCGSDNNTALYSADNYVFRWLRIRGSLVNVSNSSIAVGGSGSFSIRVGGAGTAFFRDGSYAVAASVGTQTVADGIVIGANTAGKWKFYCIRIYSRALTAAEIAVNYAVDKKRFNLP